MKKRLIILASGTAFLMLSLVSINATMQWLAKDDSQVKILACNKCDVNTRECKCGGFLTTKCLEVKGNKIKWQYKCKKCGHSFIQWEPYSK